MSSEIKTDSNQELIAWQPPIPTSELVFDDGEPLESNQHRIQMNLLIRSIKQEWERRRFFAGGNMFVYYSNEQARNRDFRGPDFFVVLDVDPDPSRLAWVVWDENGRYPDVIVELLSESTAGVDFGEKKALYEQVFKTRDYFVFDPLNPSVLQGWHLDLDRGYQPIEPNAQGWLWCETLSFWLGTWEGAVDGDDGLWLRFYRSSGELVLLPEDAERQRADVERQRADVERQRAETERQRAETERQRADRLAEQLRLLGINPDDLG